MSSNGCQLLSFTIHEILPTNLQICQKLFNSRWCSTHGFIPSSSLGTIIHCYLSPPSGPSQQLISSMPVWTIPFDSHLLQQGCCLPFGWVVHGLKIEAKVVREVSWMVGPVSSSSLTKLGAILSKAPMINPMCCPQMTFVACDVKQNLLPRMCSLSFSIFVLVLIP